MTAERTFSAVSVWLDDATFLLGGPVQLDSRLALRDKEHLSLRRYSRII